MAGTTIPEYTAEWWQTALEVPIADSPLNDPNAATDVGAVTYLYGAPGPGTFTRTATVRDDHILIPVLNAFFAIASFDPPGTTEADARAALGAAVDEFTNLHATIDGQAVPGAQLLLHRERSPAFPLDLPEGNLFGIPPEHVEITVSDGYWLMVSPLGTGDHTVSFGGEFGPAFGAGTLHMTYALNIIPLPAAAWMAAAARPLAAAGRRAVLKRQRC